MEKIADRLMASMKAANTTYVELAKKTKISKSAIQRYATGKTEKIPLDRLEIMADALGVSAAYLMGWDNGTYNTLLGLAEDKVYSDQFNELSKEKKMYALSSVYGLPKNDDEANLLNLYRELNQEGKEKLYGYADDLVSSGKYIKTDTDRMVQGEK